MLLVKPWYYFVRDIKIYSRYCIFMIHTPCKVPMKLMSVICRYFHQPDGTFLVRLNHCINCRREYMESYHRNRWSFTGKSLEESLNKVHGWAWPGCS